MSALPDHEIRRLALEQQMLEPFAEAMDREGVISNGLTHAGYDLRLGTSVEYFKNTYCLPIDPKRFKRPDGSIDHTSKCTNQYRWPHTPMSWPTHWNTSECPGT
jgi:deoxycytidine triphosphate deaminase